MESYLDTASKKERGRIIYLAVLLCQIGQVVQQLDEHDQGVFDLLPTLDIQRIILLTEQTVEPTPIEQRHMEAVCRMFQMIDSRFPPES